jgi:hypothetical protein
MISVDAQILRNAFNLFVQGHYECGPTLPPDPDAPPPLNPDPSDIQLISYNGFLEGQLTNLRGDPDIGTLDLSNITVREGRDLNRNDIIMIESNGGNIGASLVFQGTIDCSKPISTPIEGKGCMWTNPTQRDRCLNAPNVTSAWLRLQQ